MISPRSPLRRARAGLQSEKCRATMVKHLSVLHKGRIITALVSDADYADVRQYNWFAETKGRKTQLTYFIRHLPGSNNKHVSLQDHIKPPPVGKRVDHKSGDTLDNRRSNLRHATDSQNSFNTRGRGGASKYKGVWFRKDTNRWAAEIRAHKKRVSLGCFPTQIAAARAYDSAAIVLHGKFAKLNFPINPKHKSAVFRGTGYVKRKAKTP